MNAQTFARGTAAKTILGLGALMLGLVLLTGCGAEPKADDQNQGDVSQPAVSPLESKSIGEGHFLTKATVNVRDELFSTTTVIYDETTGRAKTSTMEYPEGYSVSETYGYGEDNALNELTRTSGTTEVHYTVGAPTIDDESGVMTYSWTETPPAADENTEQTRETTLTLTDGGDRLSQTKIVNSGRGGSEITTAAFNANELVEAYDVDNRPAEDVEGGQATTYGFSFQYEGTTMSVNGAGSSLSWDLTFDDDGCLVAMQDANGVVMVTFEYQSFAAPVNLAHFENQNRLMEAMYEAINATANSSTTAQA